MNDLSLRERIILGVVAAVVLYGAWSLIDGSTAKKPAPTVQRSEDRSAEMLAEIDGRLKTSALKDHDQYLVTLIGPAWPTDPFVNTGKRFDTGNDVIRGDDPVLLDGFVYSGFIRVGREVMAIINGQEYRPGEALLSGDYRIAEISPKRILLDALNATETGGFGQTFIIEIQD